MKNATPITPELLRACRAAYEEKKENRAYTAALSKTEMCDAAFSPADAAKLNYTFSVEVKTHGITNQKHSGRCWLFASMNLLREQVITRCGLEEFELSGNYFSFCDKFEKFNYFLEAAIDTADLPVGDRTLDWILAGPQDGGQWDMMVNITEKYGVLPYTVMPETYQSCNTGAFWQIANMKFREDAIELRELVRAGKDPHARKEEMLKEFYNALCVCFGEPVERFTFEYTDKNGVYHADYDITPVEFYKKYADPGFTDYVSIINSPTADKPYGRSYTVSYLGNDVTRSVRYLNLPMEELKALAITQLKAGEPVWFGCDCGKFGTRTEGIWDKASFTYGELLGFDLGLTKEQRLDYRDSAMNHAMVLCGVNLDRDGKPERWKVENSWGDEPGKKGYYCASDAWMDEFTYQVIIHRKYLKPEWLEALEQEPIVLAPWDPMGTLA